MVQKNDMTPSELAVAKDAVCLIKEIEQVEYMQDYADEENSGMRHPMYGYEHDMSHDRTGRYARGNSGHYDYYDRGRSGHSIKDRMIDKLEGMMDEAQTDYERQTLLKYIDSIRG